MMRAAASWGDAASGGARSPPLAALCHGRVERRAVLVVASSPAPSTPPRH